MTGILIRSLNNVSGKNRVANTTSTSRTSGTSDFRMKMAKSRRSTIAALNAANSVLASLSESDGLSERRAG